MPDLIVIVPSFFSIVSLLVVFVLRFLLWSNRADLGPVASLQFASALAAFISSIGASIRGLDVYDQGSPNGWCMVEAVSGCWGELSLVLWQMCTAIFFVMSLFPQSQSPHVQRRIFIAFHFFVWVPATVSTVVPGSMGLLGINHNDADFWCWFKANNVAWELGQFYIPLMVSNLLSLLTFSYAIHRILGVTRQAKSTLSEDERSEKERALFRRLALQLGVLFIVFVPDSINYMLLLNNIYVPSWAIQISVFLWRSEGYLVALLWISNLRVQQEIKKLPLIQSLRLCLGLQPDEHVQPLEELSCKKRSQSAI
eukprot:TRINITY_DN11376_c0_g1_i1.p1 TRINITY_DN11376_c0_g1~~TRINITY_DN11376_c0_g1_i1.p1  ORF type:complete len:311 (-),score=57.71 TRINITY_DN11376_c0_g1_i1:175-1107(-)